MKTKLKTIFFITFFLPYMLVLQSCSAINTCRTFKPGVMKLTLPSEDVPIASINITSPPYNAKNDGSKDVTKIFQNAIDDAAKAGGAVIFIPSGHYRFDGSLLLKETVILRGEWINPEGNDGKVAGTVFDIYANKGNEKTNAFLSLERGSGIKNMSFWYPEQRIQDNQLLQSISIASRPRSKCRNSGSIPALQNFPVIPYPWTVQCNTKSSDGDNTSIINVTFVNPYKAIKIGPEWNELHYIKNVYGTPLKKGVEMDFTTDIGRIYNLHFAPKYWSDSELKSAPSEKIVKNWLQKNATAIKIGRSDWEYMYNNSIDSYKIGVHILKTEHGVPNGAIHGLKITNAKIGILIDGVESSGYVISKADISTIPGSDSFCIYATTNFKTIVQFNSCVFNSKSEGIIRSMGTANSHLTFQNCIFKSNALSNIDINIKGGTLAVLDSVFENKVLNFKLGKETICAQILDNKFYDKKPKIKNESNGKIIVSQKKLNCKKFEINEYIFPNEPKPNSTNLFVVTDFGAKADGKTDDTKAIQKTLDLAGKNGGGTVYLPAGHYKILSHLTVPTGVELRGIWDVPHHTTSHGSVLFAYEGKGNENATPFISIEAGAGVRGFTVWYPEQRIQQSNNPLIHQSGLSVIPYPWSIRTKGKNCWIKDIALANTYQGADLASFNSEGHYVSYLCGAPLKTGIFISKNSGEGWIESLQFNPHYWARNPGYPQEVPPNIKTIWEYQRKNLVAFKFGYCKKENNLGVFVYAALKGMYFVDDNGGCNSDIILPGIDAVCTDIVVEKTGEKGINFVSGQYVVAGKKIDAVIRTTPDFTGKIALFNSIAWGHKKAAITQIDGKGKVLIQQFHSRMGDFFINGGECNLHNIVLSPQRKTKPEFVFGKKIEEASLIAVYSKEKTIIKNNAGEKLKAEYNY